MKFCEKENCRKTYKEDISGDLKECCNKVYCVAADGSRCECWMEFPQDQPYHDKNAVIELNERVDQGQDMTYYGISAAIMGVGGIVLFLVLWAKEAGVL